MSHPYARYITTVQCSPAGLFLALTIAATVAGMTHASAVATGLRITAALVLASAGTGLLAWVTIGLTRKSGQTAASSIPTARPTSVPTLPPVIPIPTLDMGTVPVTSNDVMTGPTSGMGKNVGHEPPIPMRLITRDGRALILADPGTITISEPTP